MRNRGERFFLSGVYKRVDRTARLEARKGIKRNNQNRPMNRRCPAPWWHHRMTHSVLTDHNGIARSVWARAVRKTAKLLKEKS